jgi:predicted Kef-type K+ transport protein
MATTFEWKKLQMADKVIAVTGAIALIALFLPWFGITSGPYSASVSGFSTSWGWLGGLLIVAAAAYVVLLRAGSTMPQIGYGPGVIVLGLSAIGTLVVIIRWLTLPRASYGYGSYGPRIGIILALVAGVVQAFFAYRLFRASGEAVPWAKRA